MYILLILFMLLSISIDENKTVESLSCFHLCYFLVGLLNHCEELYNFFTYLTSCSKVDLLGWIGEDSWEVNTLSHLHTE